MEGEMQEAWAFLKKYGGDGCEESDGACGMTDLDLWGF